MRRAETKRDDVHEAGELHAAAHGARHSGAYPPHHAGTHHAGTHHAGTHHAHHAATRHTHQHGAHETHHAGAHPTHHAGTHHAGAHHADTHHTHHAATRHTHQHGAHETHHAGAHPTHHAGTHHAGAHHASAHHASAHQVDAHADKPHAHAIRGGKAPAHADRQLGPPLRVMTYNVRYFGHATRGIASTGSAITRIARSIASMNPTPDLVCLQEVETQSIRATSMNRLWYPEETQLDRFMTELTMALRHKKREETFTAYYFPAHKYRLTERTNIYTTGLAVIAKDTLSVGHHNAEQPHDITHRRMVRRFKQTRICAHVAFERADGLRFDVFNTHLSLPSFLSKAFWTGDARMGFGKNQVVEAEQVLSFVESAKKSDNFLIVGDFNSLPGSPVDRLLREEGGLVDAFRRLYGDCTDQEARAFGTAGFLNLRMHLDHVYSSRSIQWLDFEGTERFGGGGEFAGLSDHVPLIGRCRMPL